MDVCGVCGGDNTTCLDCAGVPNGPKQRDLCGDCLLPIASEGFNQGCVKLGSFFPATVYVDALSEIEILLEASGLNRFRSVKCNFTSINGARYERHLIFPINTRDISIY